MIQVLDDMPVGVTGLRVSGRVSGDDLREFRSAMSTLLAGDEIRLVEVVSLFPLSDLAHAKSWAAE